MNHLQEQANSIYTFAKKSGLPSNALIELKAKLVAQAKAQENNENNEGRHLMLFSKLEGVSHYQENLDLVKKELAVADAYLQLTIERNGDITAWFADCRLGRLQMKKYWWIRALVEAGCEIYVRATEITGGYEDKRWKGCNIVFDNLGMCVEEFEHIFEK